jgi:hypothetical protein
VPSAVSLRQDNSAAELRQRAEIEPDRRPSRLPGKPGKDEPMIRRQADHPIA